VGRRFAADQLFAAAGADFEVEASFAVCVLPSEDEPLSEAPLSAEEPASALDVESPPEAESPPESPLDEPSAEAAVSRWRLRVP
jgi:hypothetical protein